VQRRGRHLDALPSNVASLLHQALRTSRGSADAWRSGWKCSRTATTARLAALTSTCTSFEIRVSSAGKGAAGNTTIEAEALQGALARMLQEPQPALDKVAVVRMNSNLHTSWGAQQCLIFTNATFFVLANHHKLVAGSSVEGWRLALPHEQCGF